MAIFSLEAIYALHILNEQFDSLPLLPYPDLGKDLPEKERLKKLLETGYRDLTKLGLIVDNKPTDVCVLYGYFIKEYAEAYYHCQVDKDYYCAPASDQSKRMSVVIKRVGDNQYRLTRLLTSVFLGVIIKLHPFLGDLENKQKDYLKSDWEVYALLRLMVRHRHREGLRIKTVQLGTLLDDCLFLDIENQLYQYNLVGEKRRSVSSDEIQAYLLDQLKVEV